LYVVLRSVSSDASPLSGGQFHLCELKMQRVAPKSKKTSVSASFFVRVYLSYCCPPSHLESARRPCLAFKTLTSEAAAQLIGKYPDYEDLNAAMVNTPEKRATFK